MQTKQNFLGLSTNLSVDDAFLVEQLPPEAADMPTLGETGDLAQQLLDDVPVMTGEFEALPPIGVPDEIADLEFFNED